MSKDPKFQPGTEVAATLLGKVLDQRGRWLEVLLTDDKRTAWIPVDLCRHVPARQGLGFYQK